METATQRRHRLFGTGKLLWDMHSAPADQRPAEPGVPEVYTSSFGANGAGAVWSQCRPDWPVLHRLLQSAFDGGARHAVLDLEWSKLAWDESGWRDCMGWIFRVAHHARTIGFESVGLYGLLPASQDTRGVDPEWANGEAFRILGEDTLDLFGISGYVKPDPGTAATADWLNRPERWPLPWRGTSIIRAVYVHPRRWLGAAWGEMMDLAPWVNFAREVVGGADVLVAWGSRDQGWRALVKRFWDLWEAVGQPGTPPWAEAVGMPVAECE